MPRSLLYIAGRLAGAVLTVLAGAFVVYVVMKAAPGDPALAVLGENARPESVAAFRHLHHLDEPFATQFWTWLSGILRGEIGRASCRESV